jgi:NAD(P)-dependent dehydrogenase (short-subunit alcohol dehydrogenase family)
VESTAFVGRVAVVTGAGCRRFDTDIAGEVLVGNGQAAAILFARAGATVAVVDIDSEAAAETQRMIEAEGGASEIFLADVTNEESTRSLMRDVKDEFGRIDILHNNVGTVGPEGDVTELDLEAWDNGLRVNVTSIVLTSRFAIPEMAAVGGGSITNVSSIAGLMPLRSPNPGSPTRRRALYPTAKAAVGNLTRSLAVDHGRQGIRANCILPGNVYTPLVARLSDPYARKARAERCLLGTEGTGWDIGKAAVFLASDDARWITGVSLAVDGGVTAFLPMA